MNAKSENSARPGSGLKAEAADFGSDQPLARGAGSVFRLRAFVIGIALCALMSTGTIYANCIIKGAFMAWAFSTPAALFLFFYLVIGNVLVRAIGRSLALRREELTLIYVMMIVSASLPTFGMVSHLLPMITNVFYFASPENQWAETIQPYVPHWLAPHDEEVIVGFYEGLLIAGQPIPWHAWVLPLFYWTLFLLALYLVSICLMVMVRRQWVENERLLYPMMHAPIAMVEERNDHPARRFQVPPLFRMPQMWIGFAIPVVIISWNALHSYFPGVTPFTLSTSFSAFRGSISFIFYFSFSLVGFSYFINRELALGIWVFYLVTQIQQGLFNTVGIQSSAKLGLFSNPQAPYLTHQALGAMLMFALLTLWRARDHLRAVWRQASDENASDGDEIMSYRAAAIGLVGGLAVMIAWLNATGIPLPAILLLLAVAFLIFVALSRIVVEAGVALVRAPLIAPDFVIATMGVSRLGDAGLTGLAYTYPWTADLVTFPMASVANALKMAHEVVAGSKRALFSGIFLAIIVTLVGAYWMMLYLSYNYGGLNLPGWWWQYSSSTGLRYIAAIMSSPSTIGFGEWFFTALGAGLMWSLVTLQQRVLWWPIHPLGLAISGTVFTTSMMWFNVFVAWLIKSLVLTYGGGRLYRQTRFFFIGMIMGSFVVAGTWLAIDYFSGMVGNLWQYML